MRAVRIRDATQSHTMVFSIGHYVRCSAGTGGRHARCAGRRRALCDADTHVSGIRVASCINARAGKRSHVAQVSGADDLERASALES